MVEKVEPKKFRARRHCHFSGRGWEFFLKAAATAVGTIVLRKNTYYPRQTGLKSHRLGTKPAKPEGSHVQSAGSLYRKKAARQSRQAFAAHRARACTPAEVSRAARVVARIRQTRMVAHRARAARSRPTFVGRCGVPR